MKTAFRSVVLFALLFSVVTFAHAAGVYEEGDTGQDVAQIQAKLSALGYDTGSADGDFGEMTTAAVTAFQKDRGLDADGVIGPATYRAIFGRDIPVASRDASSATIRRVIQTAMRYVGVPYVFGGNTPEGFDCSGYTRYVFAKSGVNLPRMADEQYTLGQSVSKLRLEPGDLVFFTTYASGASHVGIYLGEGKFISASSSRGVVVDRLDNSYWRARYVGARRI